MDNISEPPLKRQCLEQTASDADGSLLSSPKESRDEGVASTKSENQSDLSASPSDIPAVKSGMIFGSTQPAKEVVSDFIKIQESEMKTCSVSEQSSKDLATKTSVLPVNQSTCTDRVPLEVVDSKPVDAQKQPSALSTIIENKPGIEDQSVAQNASVAASSSESTQVKNNPLTTSIKSTQEKASEAPSEIKIENVSIESKNVTKPIASECEKSGTPNLSVHTSDTNSSPSNKTSTNQVTSEDKPCTSSSAIPPNIGEHRIVSSTAVKPNSYLPKSNSLSSSVVTSDPKIFSAAVPKKDEEPSPIQSISCTESKELTKSSVSGDKMFSNTIPIEAVVTAAKNNSSESYMKSSVVGTSVLPSKSPCSLSVSEMETSENLSVKSQLSSEAVTTSTSGSCIVASDSTDNSTQQTTSSTVPINKVSKVTESQSSTLTSKPAGITSSSGMIATLESKKSVPDLLPKKPEDSSADGDILQSIVSEFGIVESDSSQGVTAMETDSLTPKEVSLDAPNKLSSAELSNLSSNLEISKQGSPEVDASIEKVVMEVDEPIGTADSNNSNDLPVDTEKSQDKLLAADNSIFMDEESCDAVLRKPEPVSDIREETLAGDPRLEAPEMNESVAPAVAMDPNEDSSIDASKTPGATNDASEMSMDKTINDEEDDQEDDGETPKKVPKKRRKPRRSVFYKPRPDKKKKEKEKAEAAAAAGDETAVGSPVTNIDEDSQGSTGGKEKKEVRRFRSETVVPESTEAYTVDKVLEYMWPQDGGYGEHYFVQEHISQYIGISSFKRKYPDLRRRPIDMAERDYLKELGLVSEIACDMGLMAVRSEDVMDVLFADFPVKFDELTRNLNERRDNQLKERGKVQYQVADIDKSKLQEYGRQAAEEAALWNAALNREKREERRFSFDLQTFTLQHPTARGKKLPPRYTKVGHYPVSVLPGQYTDHCRTYSSDELLKLPLNSVCNGPLPGDTPQDEAGKPDKAEQEVTLKTEEPEEKVLLCKVCFLGKERSKTGKAEDLIVCAKCSSSSHASCVDLNPSMIPRINSYGWQCMECKNCMHCSSAEDEDKMIFCDLCDRGYHIYCVGLRRVPSGRWHCKECAKCNSCGAKTPSGNEHVKNAEWQHEVSSHHSHDEMTMFFRLFEIIPILYRTL